MISIQDIYKDIHLLHIFQPICIILGILSGYKLWIMSYSMSIHVFFSLCIILAIMLCYIFQQRLLKRIILYIFCGYIVFQTRIQLVNFQKAYTFKQMLVTATISDVNEYQDRNLLCTLNLTNIETLEDNPNIVLPKNAKGFIHQDVELLNNNISQKQWFGMMLKRNIKTEPQKMKISEHLHEKDTSINDLLNMLTPGTKIICQVDIMSISRKDHPADFDARFHAYFNNNPVNFNIKAIQIHSQQQSQGLAGIRAKLLKKLAILPNYDLAQSLLLGVRNNLTREHREIFQRLGIYHILSISGMHLSIVSFIGYLIGYLLYVLISLLGSCISEKRRIELYQQYPEITLFLPLSPRTYFKFTSITLCIAYTLLTGASIPTMRACLMYLIGLLIFFADYHTSLLHTLILACSTILCIYPEAVFSSSFQFSFIAMYVITLLPQINIYIKSKLHIRNKYLIYILQSVTVCILMSIYTAPISMYHFQQITFQPILGNLIAIPYITCIILPTLILYTLLPIGFLLKIEFQMLEILLKMLDHTSLSCNTSSIYAAGLLILVILLPFAHSRTKLFRLHALSALFLMIFICFPPEKPLMLLDKFGNIGYVKDKTLYTTCVSDSYTAIKWKKYFQAENVVQFKYESDQELFGYRILYPVDKTIKQYARKDNNANHVSNIIDVSQCMRAGGLAIYKTGIEKMNEEKFEKMNVYLW